INPMRPGRDLRPKMPKISASRKKTPRTAMANATASPAANWLRIGPTAPIARQISDRPPMRFSHGETGDSISFMAAWPGAGCRRALRECIEWAGEAASAFLKASLLVHGDVHDGCGAAEGVGGVQRVDRRLRGRDGDAGAANRASIRPHHGVRGSGNAPVQGH